MPNFLPNQITVKTMAAGLRRGGLLPESYCTDKTLSEKFIKSATAMGFHPEEAKCQVSTDQEYLAKREKRAIDELRNKNVIRRRKIVEVAV